MTTFHFVRHGQRQAGDSDDPPLSPQGRAQAESAARALAAQSVSRLYTSPLLRALQTAGIIAGVLRLAPAEELLLRERANWGDLSGQSRAEFEEMWERCSREREFVPAAGDSSVDAGRRIERFVRAAASGDAHVVAVTHGGVLADFLLNAFSRDELERVNVDFARAPYSGEVMRECSITSVRAADGVLELQRIAAHAPA